MSKRTDRGNHGNVFRLDEWRQRNNKSKKESTPTSRGDLFVNIDSDGSVNYDVKNVKLIDAPAMLMATLLLCLRLTRQIDAGEMA